jgi:hypothetical protein
MPTLDRQPESDRVSKVIYDIANDAYVDEERRLAAALARD